MRFRYLLEKIYNHGSDLNWWRGKASIRGGLLPLYYEISGPSGENFFELDWDNLIILDGCRFDLFQETYDGKGTLSSKISVGSATSQFLNISTRRENYNDIVYMTANPKVNVNTPNKFHKVINIWEFGWDSGLGTVPPSEVVNAVLSSIKEYRDKRFVIHFMQPHFPFIGPEALDVLDSQRGIDQLRATVSHDEIPGDAFQQKAVWDLLRNNQVSRETVWQLYKENLQVVIPSVKTLIDGIEGKTVVTADHGNMLGETAGRFPVRIYGHPPGIRTPELTKVPWLVISSEKRREVSAEDTNRSDDEMNNDEVTQKLKTLGYIE